MNVLCGKRHRRLPDLRAQPHGDEFARAELFGRHDVHVVDVGMSDDRVAQPLPDFTRHGSILRPRVRVNVDFPALAAGVAASVRNAAERIRRRGVNQRHFSASHNDHASARTVGSFGFSHKRAVKCHTPSC